MSTKTGLRRNCKPEKRRIRVATSLTNRPIPDGFQLDWDSKVWNVGHVFVWSEFFKTYTQSNSNISIKPGETLAAAFKRHCGIDLTNDYEIFFAGEKS